MKILFLAYNFGTNSPGGISSLRIADALSELGHDVTVICSQHCLKDWEHGDVFYCSDFPSRPSNFFFRISNTFQRDLTHLSWKIRAKKVAKNVLSSLKPDFIYAKSEPPIVCQLGSELSKKFSIPILMHFTDPVPLPIEWNPNIKQRKRDITLMKKILPQATLISFGNEAMLNYQKSIMDYDYETFISPDPSPKLLINNIEHKEKKIKTIIYFGAFYGNRNPMNLFTAIDSLNNEGFNCKLLVYDINRLHLKESAFVKFLGRTNNAKEVLSNADCFIDLDAEDKYPVFISSKLKDYLLYTTPIVSITPENSPTRNLLQNLRTVFIAHNTIEEIKLVIKQAFSTPLSFDDYKERKTIQNIFAPKKIAQVITNKMISKIK